MALDPQLLTQSKNAVARLRQRHGQGAYRIIRDPEGVVSLWAIEGTENGPFSLTFADRGRISTHIEQMSPAFVKSFVEYVNRTARR